MIWSDIYKELSARILNMRQMIDSLDELSPELAEELEGLIFEELKKK